MQVLVTFRHMDSTEALKKHAIEKIDRLKKFLDNASDAHVVLSVDKLSHKAEITIPCFGVTVRGEEISGDMYNSIDRAVEKIDRQVKRYRSKLIKNRPRDGAKRKIRMETLEPVSDIDANTVSDIPPTIIETKEVDARPMMLDEAVMHMDLMDDDILVFLNTKTDHVNILYRKRGNKYGLIETH